MQSQRLSPDFGGIPRSSIIGTISLKTTATIKQQTTTIAEHPSPQSPLIQQSPQLFL